MWGVNDQPCERGAAAALQPPHVEEGAGKLTGGGVEVWGCGSVESALCSRRSRQADGSMKAWRVWRRGSVDVCVCGITTLDGSASAS
eukprot:352133-Chlamydomonas_euryale.AAC.1